MGIGFLCIFFSFLFFPTVYFFFWEVFVICNLQYYCREDEQVEVAKRCRGWDGATASTIVGARDRAAMGARDSAAVGARDGSAVGERDQRGEPGSSSRCPSSRPLPPLIFSSVEKMG